MVDMNQTDFGLEPEQGDQPPQLGMVQCQVTGKWLPEEETVEFQGYRVGAEGKEVLLERLRSGAGTGQLLRPGGWRRVGCAALDMLIIMVVEFIVIFIMTIAAFSQFFANSGSNTNPQSALQSFSMIESGVFIIIPIATLLYYGFMHGLRGATIGKSAGRLKVVRLDGSPVDLRTAMFRSFVFVGPWLVVQIAVFVMLTFANLHALWFIITRSVLEFVVFAYLITTLIVALVDTEQQRAIHDRIAHTKVVFLDV